MKKIFLWVLSALGIVVFLFMGYWSWAILAFQGTFESHYSKEDLIENYLSKTREIYELKKYAGSIIPYDKSVSIEFEDDHNLFIFHLSGKSGSSDNWDININSKKTDSLLTELGWTKDTLKQLKEKMDNANCISVENGEPFTIGYQRSNMGMYFYNLFEKPLTDSLKKEYNDGCTHILYNEKVALEFGGGAIGQQCFEDYFEN